MPVGPGDCRGKETEGRKITWFAGSLVTIDTRVTLEKGSFRVADILEVAIVAHCSDAFLQRDHVIVARNQVATVALRSCDNTAQRPFKIGKREFFLAATVRWSHAFAFL